METINNFIKDEKSEKNEKNEKNEKDQFFKKDDSITVKLNIRGNAIEKITVPKWKLNPEQLINRGIILYGPTGSGKTRIIREFMSITKRYFPIVIVFAPTNMEKHDYDNLVPKQLIHEDLKLDYIQEIYNRQRSTTEIYNNSNNLNILNKLFMKVANIKNRQYYDKLLSFKKNSISEVDRKIDDSEQRRQKLEEIESIFEKKLISFYKGIINANIDKLKKMDLSQEEKYAIRYRNLNPRMLIIFDDAFTEVMQVINEGKKKKNQVIENFFFKGRHANISHWYAFQDDNRLNSEIRKNAHLSIFTDIQVALSYFTRAANSFPMSEKKKAETVINTIFSRDHAPEHAKLIYNRLDKNKFYYIVAGDYKDEDVQMCSSTVREYCQKISARNDNFDKNNPYFRSFQDNL